MACRPLSLRSQHVYSTGHNFKVTKFLLLLEAILADKHVN